MPGLERLSLALSLAAKKKGFPASPRTLAVTSRGDRIRTCDLVLPKHPRYQAAPRPGRQILIHRPATRLVAKIEARPDVWSPASNCCEAARTFLIGRNLVIWGAVSSHPVPSITHGEAWELGLRLTDRTTTGLWLGRGHCWCAGLAGHSTGGRQQVASITTWVGYILALILVGHGRSRAAAAGRAGWAISPIEVPPLGSGPGAAAAIGTDL